MREFKNVRFYGPEDEESSPSIWMEETVLLSDDDEDND